MAPYVDAGRSSFLKFFSILYSRISYSIGGTGLSIPNGYTNMSTVCTTSKWLLHYLLLYTVHQFDIILVFNIINCEQICYTIWLNLGIRTPSWNFVSRVCHDCWSCPDRTSLVHPMAVDGVEGVRDGWSSQWISLPMEPIEFPATLWRVSRLGCPLVLENGRGILFVHSIGCI